MAEATEKSRPLLGAAPSAVKSEETDTVAVKLVLDGEIADDVVIRGSWDDWSRDWQLERNKKTLENRFCLDLPCGYYEYKYRGGRRWFCDKSKPMVRNAFGTHNNYMEVKKVPESASPLVQGLRSKVAHANMKIQKKVDLEILPSGKGETQEETTFMGVEKQSQDTEEFETLENDLEVKKVSDDVSTNKVAHVSVRIEKKIDLETVDIEEPEPKLDLETKTNSRQSDEPAQDKTKTQKKVDIESLKASEYKAQSDEQEETEAGNAVHGIKEGSAVSDPSLALVQTEKDDIVFISNDRKSDIKALIETAKQDVNVMEAALYNMEVLHADMVEYKSVLQTVEKSEEEGDLDATGKVVSAGRIYQDLRKNLEEETSKEKVSVAEDEAQKPVPDTTERAEQKAETTEHDKITEKSVSDRQHPTEDIDFAIIPLPESKDDATVQEICGRLDESVSPQMTSPTSTTSSSNGWIVVDNLEDEATPQASVSHGSVVEGIQDADEILKEISITETSTDETVVAIENIADKIQNTAVVETPPSDKTTENDDEMLKESSTTEAPLDEIVMAIQDVVDNLQDAATGEAPPSENTMKIAHIKMVEQMEGIAATEASSPLKERVKDVASAVGSTEVNLTWKGESRGDLFVQGSWDGWRQAYELTKSEEGWQCVNLTLPVGLHEYKFRTGNSWFHDETKPTMLNAFRTLNNILQVSGETSKETIPLEVTMPDDTLEETDLCIEENNDLTKAATLEETTGDVVSDMVVMEDKMSSQKSVPGIAHQTEDIDASMATLPDEKVDATVQDIIEEYEQNITAELKPAEDPTSTDSENNGWTVVDNSEDDASPKSPMSPESVQKLAQNEAEMFEEISIAEMSQEQTVVETQDVAVKIQDTAISETTIQDKPTEKNEMFEEISITETPPDETAMATQDVVDEIQDTAISAKPPPDKTTEKGEALEDISMKEMPTEETDMAAQDVTVKIQDTTNSETTPPDQPTDKASISVVEMIEDMAAVEILPLDETDVVLDVAQMLEEMRTVPTSSPVNMTEMGSSEIAEKAVNTTKGETTAHAETADVEAPIARMSDEMAKVAVSSALKVSEKLLPEILASTASDTMVPVKASEVEPTVAIMSDQMAKGTTSSAVEMSAKPLSKHADTSTSEAAETAAVGSTDVRLVWKGEIRGDVFVQGSWDGWRQSYHLNKSEEGLQIVTLTLPVGRYEYKFRVGNSWFHDETKPTMLNAFRTLNNILQVPGETSEEIMHFEVISDKALEAPALCLEKNSGFTKVPTSEETTPLEVAMSDAPLDMPTPCVEENNDFKKAATLPETREDVVDEIAIMEDNKPVSDRAHQTEDIDTSMTTLQDDENHAKAARLKETVKDVVDDITEDNKPVSDRAHQAEDIDFSMATLRDEEDHAAFDGIMEESKENITAELKPVEDLNLTDSEKNGWTVVGKSEDEDTTKAPISVEPKSVKTAIKEEIEMLEELSITETFSDETVMATHDIADKIQDTDISETVTEDTTTEKDKVFEEISIMKTDETNMATQDIVDKIQNTAVCEPVTEDTTTEKDEMSEEISITKTDETVMATQDIADKIEKPTISETPPPDVTTEKDEIAEGVSMNEVDSTASEKAAAAETAEVEATVARMSEEMAKVTTSSAVDMSTKSLSEHADTTTSVAEMTAVGGTEVRLVWKGEVRGDVFVQGSWDGWRQSYKLNKSEDGGQSVTLTLPVGLHEYKFRTGDSWFYDETKTPSSELLKRFSEAVTKVSERHRNVSNPAMLNVFVTLNNILQVPALPERAMKVVPNKSNEELINEAALPMKALPLEALPDVHENVKSSTSYETAAANETDEQTVADMMKKLITTTATVNASVEGVEKPEEKHTLPDKTDEKMAHDIMETLEQMEHVVTTITTVEPARSSPGCIASDTNEMLEMISHTDKTLPDEMDGGAIACKDETPRENICTKLTPDETTVRTEQSEPKTLTETTSAVETTEEVLHDTGKASEELTSFTTLQDEIEKSSEPCDSEKRGEKSSPETPIDKAPSDATDTDNVIKTEDGSPIETPAPDASVEMTPAYKMQSAVGHAAAETLRDKKQDETVSQKKEKSNDKDDSTGPLEEKLENITVDDLNHSVKEEAPPCNKTIDKAPTDKDKTLEDTVQKETNVSNETASNSHKEMADKIADTALTQTPYPEIRVEKLRDTATIEGPPEKTWVRIALHDYAHIKLLWKGKDNGCDVYVQGSWDGWRRSHKLKRGEYSVTLKLSVGMYEYKFRIGNNWFHDNTKTTVANCFNTLNNVINVTMTT